MRIREAMHAPAQTCTATTTVEDAARRMLVADVGTLVVVDDSGLAAGLLTDRDLGVRGYTRGLTGESLVGEIMTHAVVTIGADDDIFDAASTMAARGIRRLPVVDHGSVVGVIALDDLMRLLGREIGEVARAVGAQADARHYAGWTSWDVT